MMSLTHEYVTALQNVHATGKATEHSYRPALKTYVEALVPGITATNEPKRQKCGAPDYIITKKEVDVGYIEAKDVNISLDKIEKSGQMKRYLESLDNLILTDYLEFRFYSYGQKTATIRIAEVDDFFNYEGPVIKPLPDNFEQLERLLTDFVAFQGQTIKSAKKLAEMMARKARLMKEVFEKAVQAKEDDNSLHDQLEAFREILIHDMDEAQFADVYAQTITYGLFTARLHDETLETFSRQEARELIPRSNPFLRWLFDYVCGAGMDNRVTWIVDALCEVYRATNIRAILEDFGKQTGRNDPIVHFYETFLGEYDSKLRKARGVWYTPEPVVNFIVRAIDDVLKTHFKLPDGLADTSMVTIEVDDYGEDKRRRDKKAKKKIDVHKVQLLDVAAGTGMFTAEAIKQIYERFHGQQGMWSAYVEQHLLPRLHGFEILMASYAMCHMKIDMLLAETGYRPSNPDKPPRLSVYLTNSLEEHHPDVGTLFASWLAREANEASRIKKDMPIMVAYGNPPYSVSSQNKGEWIEALMQDYKKDLNERNINPLSDDYIKFIRYAEHYVEKTGYGIVAMITNNSFYDGIIHRQMRKNLLETFDSIYVYDLHGSAKKKETAPDGGPDKNVFDIQQGVGITIMIKDGTCKGKLAELYHLDSYGPRDAKYTRLWEESIRTAEFQKLDCAEPYYFFVPKDFAGEDRYIGGFQVEELFIEMGLGIKFRKDNLLVKNNHSVTEAEKMVHDMQLLEEDKLLKKYNFSETHDWTIREQRKNFQDIQEGEIQKVLYRTFDKRFTYFPITRISKIIPRGDSRKALMAHILRGENLYFLAIRNSRLNETGKFFLANCLVNKDAVSSLDNCHCFPLYLYPDASEAQPTLEATADTGEGGRRPNLNEKIVAEIAAKLGIPFVPDHEQKEADDHSRFSPLDLLDYIYAVLHSPAYRETYREFLKIDFPRIPYPENTETFWKLAALGSELRSLHLLEHPVLGKPITTFPESGSNEVEKPTFTPSTDDPNIGRVHINKEQYFDAVPLKAWEFYIGGYQPAQKWLKDRKGRTLTLDDLRHWQKIIVALQETDRLMKEIDEVWKP